MIFKPASLLVALAMPAAFARVGDNNKKDIERVLAKPIDIQQCIYPGNGFPSGKPDFKLNLLGKKASDREYSSNGDNMVIQLHESCKGSTCTDVATTKIILVENTEGKYEIIDADGSDGEATLSLPDPFESDLPCYNEDGDGQVNAPDSTSCTEYAKYAVYARVNGKGSLDMGLCVEGEVDGKLQTWCQASIITLSGRKAQDISRQLLTVCADADGDGDLDKVGLFDELVGVDNEVYYWDTTNDGVRKAEMRFFSIATLMGACKGDSSCEACVEGNLVTRDDAIC